MLKRKVLASIRINGIRFVGHICSLVFLMQMRERVPNSPVHPGRGKQKPLSHVGVWRDCDVFPGHWDPVPC